MNILQSFRKSEMMKGIPTILGGQFGVPMENPFLEAERKRRRGAMATLFTSGGRRETLGG